MTDTTQEEKVAIRRQQLINRMWAFHDRVRPEDCAGLTGQGEKVQYKHKHKSIKRHGGKPPADYTAVELLIDFKIAMKAKSYEEAIPVYYQLKRMLNW